MPTRPAIAPDISIAVMIILDELTPATRAAPGLAPDARRWKPNFVFHTTTQNTTTTTSDDEDEPGELALDQLAGTRRYAAAPWSCTFSVSAPTTNQVSNIQLTRPMAM